MTWFERLTGFSEQFPRQVRTNLSRDGNTLKSHVNGKEWVCGDLETPSLAELRERARSGAHGSGNETDWILGAVDRALNLYEDSGLDVAIVSYGRSNPSVKECGRAS